MKWLSGFSYKVSVKAFSFSKSLSNETTTWSEAERPARMQSTMSALDFWYMKSDFRIADLSGLMMPLKFKMRHNLSMISFLGTL